MMTAESGITARPAIPETAEALTADWMRQALAAGGVAGVPATAELVVEDAGAGSGALSDTLRCTWNSHDGAAPSPRSVIVKLSSSNRRSLRIARMVSMYKRECAFFRLLAPCVRIGLPALWYGDFQESGHRFVLVLEDLGGLACPDPIDGADAAQVRRAVRGAARLHGSFRGRMDQPPLSDFAALVGPTRAWLPQFAYLASLAPCLERFGGLFSGRMRKLLEAFGPRVFDHARGLATGPRTLTHGDYKLGNLFFGQDGGDDFKVIDWQTTGIMGDGLYDVAYFMTSSVPTELRRGIEREALEEYHGVLCELGAKDFTFEECWRRYRANVLGTLVPLVCACGGLDMSHERIRRTGELMMRRALAAIEDLDAAEFMPAGGGFLTAAHARSVLSAWAYRAYSLCYRVGRPRTGRTHSDAGV